MAQPERKRDSTKYRVLSTQLMAYLQTLELGSMLPPEMDMMKRFNASRNTYRSAVDLLKRQGILKSQSGFGTQLIRHAAATQAPPLVQVVLPDAGDPFWYGVMEGLNAVLQKEGLQMLYSNAYDRTDRYLDILRHASSSRLQGLIVVGHFNSFDGYHMSDFVDLPHTILIDNAPEDFKGDFISTDDVHGAQLMTEHMISLGHSSILHLGGHNCFTHRSRREGYIKAMNAHYLDLDIVKAGASLEDGYKIGKSLLADRHRLPSAVFAVNDLVAIGFVQALQEAGLEVPRDISVGGYADVEALMLRHQIHLSSVHQSSQQLGQTAAEILLKRLRGIAQAPRQILLPVTLVDRGSIRNLKTDAKPTRKKA